MTYGAHESGEIGILVPGRFPKSSVE